MHSASVSSRSNEALEAGTEPPSGLSLKVTAGVASFSSAVEKAAASESVRTWCHEMPVPRWSTNRTQ